MTLSIAQTRPQDAKRRAELLAMAATRDLSDSEANEIAELERREDIFERTCRGWAPINPLALGFAWNDMLRHPADPDDVYYVREGGRLSKGPEMIDLVEATRQIAIKAGQGVAIGGWTDGRTNLGEVAGLRHPASTARINEPTASPAPVPAMGDLFD